jgi:hypothetical protein
VGAVAPPVGSRMMQFRSTAAVTNAAFSQFVVVNAGSTYQLVSAIIVRAIQQDFHSIYT